MPISQYLQIDIKSPHNLGKIPGVIKDLIEKDVEFSIPPTTMYHYADMQSSPDFLVSPNDRDSTSADSVFSPIQSAASSNGIRPINEEGIIANQEMHLTAAPIPTNSLIPTAGHSLVDPTLSSAFNFGMFPPPAINVTDSRSLNMLFSEVTNNGITVDTSRAVTKSSNPMGEASAGMPRRDSIDTLFFPLHQQLSSTLVRPNFCGHVGVGTNATAQNHLAALQKTSQNCLLGQKRAASVRDSRYIPFTASQKEKLKMMFDHDQYPDRTEKEKIAALFNVSFQKVDRYFSKQRSKMREQK